MMIFGRTPLGLSLGDGELSFGLDVWLELCWLVRGALGIPLVLIQVLSGGLMLLLPLP